MVQGLRPDLNRGAPKSKLTKCPGQEQEELK